MRHHNQCSIVTSLVDEAPGRHAALSIPLERLIAHPNVMVRSPAASMSPKTSSAASGATIAVVPLVRGLGGPKELNGRP
jgi:hypothetical protein